MLGQERVLDPVHLELQWTLFSFGAYSSTTRSRSDNPHQSGPATSGTGSYMRTNIGIEQGAEASSNPTKSREADVGRKQSAEARSSRAVDASAKRARGGPSHGAPVRHSPDRQTTAAQDSIHTAKRAQSPHRWRAQRDRDRAAKFPTVAGDLCLSMLGLLARSMVTHTAHREPAPMKHA